VEIGTQKGQFIVIRLYPTDENPEGGFVLRVVDAESGITFVASLSTADGLKLGAGFNTDGDAAYFEQVGKSAPVIAMPTDAERRIHSGSSERRVPIEEENPDQGHGFISDAQEGAAAPEGPAAG
jgi:hypothetical protein